MSLPMREDPYLPARTTWSSGGNRRDRVLVARKWAYLITSAAYIPLPYPEIEAELLALVDELFDALRTEPFDAQPAHDVAHRLVRLNCVSEAAFQHSIDVLGKALLGQQELRTVVRLPEKVVALIGGLSAAFVEEVRMLTLQQQEDLNRTLLAIGRDSRVNFHVAQTRLDTVLESAATGVAITDQHGRFLRTNPALGEILGHSPSEFGRLTLFDVVTEDDAPFLRDACDRLMEGLRHRLRQQRTLVSRSGDAVPVTVTITALPESDEPDRLLVLVQDDSELNLLQRQLTRQSLHDVLTGLPNRQFFTTRLESALHKADPVTGATVYHLGLDSFAMVSNGLGRRVGDQLLKVVAERLKTAVATERAVVARLDSDEFAILIENTDDTPDIETTVDRINKELAEPVYIDGQGVTVSTSIGVVHRPRKDTDPAELLRASDLALRRAKGHGRRQWELFDATQDAHDRADFNLATTMSSAWEMGEVELLYRPQVELRGERVVGLSASLRWEHPTMGALTHERCVRLAEQTGLMLALGDWMLHSACTQLGQWQQESGFDLPLTVGLSAGQAADPDLVGRTLRILDETRTAPARLRLGIPAHVLRGDRPEPSDNLKVLADAGVAVELHEFGSATADLAAVEDLPVDAVRLGRALVASQAERAAARQASALDRALTDLVTVTHLAGATVVVDGVDTEQQADWWRRTGADMALGDCFTKH
jgi:diguanylate cyclase (GGDEF)-like protein/PAS domain S-box-containing protein